MLNLKITLILASIVIFHSTYANSQTIKVLNYNVWDVGPVGGEYTDQRLEEICKIFKEQSKSNDSWDVIFIQEIWPLSKKEVFSDCGYKYTSSVDTEYDDVTSNLSWLTDIIFDEKIDTGLRILSKHPLLNPMRLTYSVNGTWKGIAEDGDILSNKSAMYVVMNHETLGPIQLINTHLVSRGSKDNNKGQRQLQLKELRDFFNSLDKGHPTILAGDFNVGPVKPGETPHPIYNSPDTWNNLLQQELFPDFKHTAGNQFLCTFCPTENIFASEIDQSLDHIFVSSQFDVLYTRRAMMSKIVVNETTENGVNLLEIPLSDHFAIETLLQIRNN